MRIVVLGGPGAGKGTQLKRLSKYLGIIHISTGDIFRDHIMKNTELGVIANAYISRGNLVPDTITCDMVAGRLADSDCDAGYALDGFPRTLEQAKFLESYLYDRKEEIDIVIDIDVDDDVIIDRLCGRRTCLNCGATYHIQYNKPSIEECCDICGNKLIQRKDDELDTIKSRLKVYHSQTRPLKDYYKQMGKLLTIDGNGSADEVAKKILEALEINK